MNRYKMGAIMALILLACAVPPTAQAQTAPEDWRLTLNCPPAASAGSSIVCTAEVQALKKLPPGDKYEANYVLNDGLFYAIPINKVVKIKVGPLEPIQNWVHLLVSIQDPFIGDWQVIAATRVSITGLIPRAFIPLARRARR